MLFIYKITNTVNGKIYIGKSRHPTARFEQHKRDARKNSDLILHRAIRKYGEDNFIMTVIDETESEEEINILERRYINEFDCCVLTGSELGYNATKGGDGFTSEETSFYLKRRTEEGRNPFSKGGSAYEANTNRVREMIANHQHPFQTEENRTRVAEYQRMLVAEDRHPLAGERGSKHSKMVQAKRIEDGSFHMLQPEMKERMREKALREISEGRHNSQIEHECPHCGKIGKGPMMKRWHFDNCKQK